MPMLTAKDIAAALACKERHAHDLMREMNAIDIGGGRLRVERADFEAWKQAKKEAAVARNAARKGRPTSSVHLWARLPAVPVANSSDKPPIRLTQPPRPRRNPG